MKTDIAEGADMVWREDAQAANRDLSKVVVARYNAKALYCNGIICSKFK